MWLGLFRTSWLSVDTQYRWFDFWVFRTLWGCKARASILGRRGVCYSLWSRQGESTKPKWVHWYFGFLVGSLWRKRCLCLSFACQGRLAWGWRRFKGIFFWGGGALMQKPYLVRWKTVCSKRKKGELGVRCISTMNKALLCKWSWLFANERGAFWM